MLEGIIPISLLWATSAFGEPVTTRDGSITRLHDSPWSSGPYLPLAGNWKNISGLSETGIYRAITRALMKWSYASGRTIQFDYWQGSDPRQFVPATQLDGLSSVYFSSSKRSSKNTKQSRLPRSPPLRPAYTKVWTKEETGEIIEVDIELNDNDFLFTSRAEPPTTPNELSQSLWIEDIVSHEIGHAFGMDDSGVFGATMFRNRSTQSTGISCDDYSGIHSAYDDLPVNQTSRLTGTVVTSGGQAVLAAEVLAISATHGVVMGSSLTDHRGTFYIKSLYPDEYLILAQPIFGTEHFASEYFAGFDHRICPYEQFFSRTFLQNQQEPNTLQTIKLGAGQVSVSARIRLQCAPDSGVSIGPTLGSVSPQEAPLINPKTNPGFSIVDQIQRDDLPGDFYYRIQVPSGALTLHSLSHALHSPLQMEMALFSPEEPSHSEYNQPIVQSSAIASRPQNPSLNLIDLAPGNYVLRIHARLLPENDTTLDPEHKDRSAFFVLTGTTDPNPLPSQPCLTNMLPTSEIYRSPHGPPRRRKDLSPESNTKSCSIAHASRKHSDYWTMGFITLIALRQRRSQLKRQDTRHPSALSPRNKSSNF